MSQRKVKRERNLFYFAGRLINVELWLRHNTTHQKTTREEKRGSTPNMFTNRNLLQNERHRRERERERERGAPVSS